MLVIDDSNTIRRSAEIFLRQGGHEVVLAEDGFDALAKVNDHEPELIFCDILMPRLDGYQTCAIIKRNPRFAHVPVIMLSSKDGLFDKARGRMVGSEDYLTKPFTKEQLLRAVQTVPPRRRLTPTLPRQAAPTAEDTAMPIHKILLVDDSKTELHHLSDCWRKRGYKVRTAENGEEAMRRLAEDKPDLILMDVVMPGQNGFQLTRAITRDPRYRRRAGDHVHQQEPGDRQGLGHAPGRARLRRQAGRRRRAGRQDQGASAEPPSSRLHGQQRSPARTAEPAGRAAAGGRAPKRRGGLAGGRVRRRRPAAAAGPAPARSSRSPRCMPVPHTQPWFVGRGQPARRPARRRRPGGLPGPARADRRRRRVREQSPAAGASTPRSGSHCAVLVDRLAGLRSAEQLSAEPPTPAPQRPAFAGARWRDAEGRVWQEIDLAALARNEHFLAIAA